MQPANPYSYRINGNETKGFTFAPGADPYCVAMRTRGYIPMCVIVWADNELHVRAILRELVAFGRAKTAAYLEQLSEYDRHSRGDAARYRLQKLDALEACINGGDETYHLEIELFDRTHAVKVAWAANATVM